MIDEFAAPEIRFEYSMHAPLRGRAQVREFARAFRAAFPDLGFDDGISARKQLGLIPER